MIEITKLDKSFGKREVLSGATLRVSEGETVALIGSSGSGKSTLLRCLNLLERPDAGTIRIGQVRIDAENIDKNSARALRGQTAMVFQNFNLFANKTALGNVAEALIIVKRIPRPQALELAEHHLDQVGMAGHRSHYPGALSGGQKQRVAIARAVALDPRVILFDEPTSALDPEMVGEVLEIINDLAAQRKTMLIVTHEMSFARSVANQVAFLDGGRIVESGDPQQFFADPQTERARQFLSRFQREFQPGH